MTKLFSIGDTLSKAYQVTGVATVSFEHGGEEFQLSIENALLGALEFLLSNKPYAPNARLYNCTLNDDAVVTEVFENNLEQKLKDFDQGIDSNVFLAQLLTLANEYYLSKEKLLPKEISEYQLRAKAYYTFVDSLRKVNLQAANEKLAAFVAKCRETEMFKDGLLWGRGEGNNLIDLPPQPLQRFIKSFKEGSVICKEGDTDGEMYVLLQGTISVQVGNSFVAQLSLPGEAVGELSLFLEDRRSATLVADEKVLVYVIPQEHLLAFHDSHPDVFLIIARTTADRIYRVLERVRRFSFALKGENIGSEKLFALKKELATKGRSELRNLQKNFKEICESSNDSRLSLIWDKMQGISED
ncbi:MAG: cyclic nucleotide-binding domain-containing protein [Bdellovibrionota bacterium]